MDDTKFRTLLDLWNHQQILWQADATIADLAKSRAELDSARLAACLGQLHPIAA